MLPTSNTITLVHGHTPTQVGRTPIWRVSPPTLIMHATSRYKLRAGGLVRPLSHYQTSLTQVLTAPVWKCLTPSHAVWGCLSTTHVACGPCSTNAGEPQHPCIPYFALSQRVSPPTLIMHAASRYRLRGGGPVSSSSVSSPVIFGLSCW